MKLILSFFAILAIAMANDEALEKYINDGNNKLSAKFFSEVVQENPGKSVVMSGFSLLQPLAMLGLASVDESHDELLDAVGLPNDNVTKEAFPLINGKLRSVKGVELKMATKIYIPLGYELNKEFAGVSKNVFGSEVGKVNFVDNKKTAGEINSWVEDQTNNRIKDLVDPDSLDGETRAVLVNAIYFKGKWKNPFNKKLTTDRDFHVSKSKTIKVPTMFQKENFAYGESSKLDAKILEMPYDGFESSLVIVLPNKIDGLAELQDKLKDSGVLDQELQNLYGHEVEVHLPKFKIETTIDLTKVLKKCGITKMFSPATAKLDKLLDGQSNLYVSDAKQKAFIEVNEEGAEAAAANVFTGLASSAFVPKERLKFIADRPFYFHIQATRMIVFQGIYEPRHQCKSKRC